MSRRLWSYLGTFVIPAALCALALALPGTAIAAEPGAISGTVTAEGGASPEIFVCAEAVDEEAYGCEETGPGGTYEIVGLPAGEYIVSFFPLEGNWVRQYWDDESSWGVADPVMVVSGSTTSGIDAELEQGGSISGIVTSAATGLPVRDVEVCATSTGTERCAETDTSGEYTIDALAAGSWSIYFYAYETEGALLSGPYAGGTVSLNAKEARTGINAALQVSGSISGTVRLAATGAPLSGVVVCLTEASRTAQLGCLKTPPSGRYRFTGVWAGAFKVAFSPLLSELVEPELAAFIEREEGFAPDGYPTQWWNGQATFAAATPIAVAPSAAVSGIDGALGPPAVTPVVAPPAVAAPVKSKPVLKCHRGFVKRKVRGKPRCVKKHKVKRHKAKKHRPARHRRSN
jgi:Carboxypeptidase regulatory-like domain